MNRKDHSTMGWLLLAGWLGGCAASNFPGGPADRPQRVRAEYRGLENQTVAVLIQRPEPYRDPLLGYELSMHLARRLQDHVPNIRMVHPKRVEAYRIQNPDWFYRPYAESARALKAQRLLIVRLQTYRLLEAPHHRWWGRVLADVDVFEAAGEAGRTGKTFRIETRYPDEPEPLDQIHNEKTLRLAVAEVFSIKVARKFHDHDLWRPRP